MNEKVTPYQKIAEPLSKELVLEDIRSLSEQGPIAHQGVFDVYLAPADAIPSILLEIGRLRQLTFRAVQEGTPLPRDLSDFDQRYQHLFLWDREEEKIAGAYRLGRTDILFAEFGPAGLYTSSMYDFEKPLLDFLNPALELGRSFITQDYQKSLHALLGLWKGIGAFVTKYPRYSKLFGPVSVSQDYTPMSHNLIVKFLKKKRMNKQWSDRVKALHPFQERPEDLCANLESIEEVSARISEAEPDGKRIPVLLKQYLKMNASLLEFTIDPDFGHCLHALVLVDLKEAPAVLMNRYLGKKGYARFLQEA